MSLWAIGGFYECICFSPLKDYKEEELQTNIFEDEKDLGFW